MIRTGLLVPSKLVDRRVTLEEGIQELVTMNQFKGIGIAVIDRFD
jgi:alcohol dehydrogenase